MRSLRALRRSRWLATSLLLLAHGAGLGACNERFEFDRLAAADAGAAGAGTQAGAPSQGGGGASAGAALAGGGAAVMLGCGSDQQCPSHLRCVNGDCRQCAGDIDCTAADPPLCEPELHRCVQCLGSSDCANGFVCDSRTHRCLQACAAQQDCPPDAHSCDERHGVCIECDGDNDCAGAPLGPHCAVDGGSCAACRTWDDCPDQRCDRLSGRCVDCLDGDDCSSGLCDPTLGVCLP